MGWTRKYELEFKGLKEGLHEFDYEVKDEFFEHFDQGLLDKGELSVKVTLEKRNAFLHLDFYIEGWVELVCDRCLEKYKQSLIHKDDIFVKFSETEQQNDEKVLWLCTGEHSVNLAQLIYEFIIVSIPLKHIHPEDENGDSICNKEMIRKIEKYTRHEKVNNETDPRWAVLKDIQKNN